MMTVYQTLLFATQVGKSHYESHRTQSFESPLQQISQVTLHAIFINIYKYAKSWSCATCILCLLCVSLVFSLK
jgi:hypothetical protein